MRLVAAAELDLPFLRSQQEWEHGQALPAVGEVQHSLAWAEHWLVVTPVWLGDMPAMLKLYHDAGFTGPIRVDHVPTMAGEDNSQPSYGALGRLFATGYLKGALQALKIPFQ